MGRVGTSRTDSLSCPVLPCPILFSIFLLLDRFRVQDPYFISSTTHYSWLTSLNFLLCVCVEAESIKCHDRTITAMEEQGMDVKVVLDCVASRACNSITATYYLLQQKYRTAGARAAREGSQDRQSLVAGPDSAHVSVDREREGERERSREREREKYKSKKADSVVKEKALQEVRETEIETETEEAEETILITLPKNYYTVNSAALHTKIAMSKAREEQNAALGNNESNGGAAGGSESSITTMSYDNSSANNSNSNSNAISARVDEKSAKNSNVIPSYLSLRAKSGVKTAAIPTPPSTSAPTNIEHVMRRPDLQPPSFAARRGGRAAAAATRTGRLPTSRH